MTTVFKNFTQAELDKQYSPSQWVTRSTSLQAILNHIARLEQGTRKCEQSSACVEKYVRYSHLHEACTLDLHHPQLVMPDTPLVVYIHGGYWCAGVLERSGAWMANCLIDTTGCGVAAVEYGLCDRVSLDDCVHHIRLAVAFLHRRFPGRPLILVGHSAGGHLVSMMLSTDWSEQGKEYCLPKGEIPFKAVVPVSGIFDLQPIRLSCVNQESNLHLENDFAQTQRNSPLCLIEQAKTNCSSGVQVVVVVAAGDSPEFKRQSQEYYHALLNATFLEVPGKDHFSVIEELDNPNDDLTRVLIDRIRSSKIQDQPKPKVSFLLQYRFLALGVTIMLLTGLQRYSSLRSGSR